MGISVQSRRYKDSEIFDSLGHEVGFWFKDKFGSFSEPQRYAIMNIKKGRNTLVSAPTGSGKTFSAFTGIIDELIQLSKEGKLEDKVYCVYVSPLKALSRDININLKVPLEEIAEREGSRYGIRVAVRTGDTSPQDRAKMLRKVPHILITTPETLSILLVAPRFRTFFKDVKWGIIDEIHSLAANKRGVHLSLSLERLQLIAGPYTRIGLSATIAPLEDVAGFLVGYENGKQRDCDIIDANFDKKLDLKLICPVPDIITASQTELENSTYALLHQLIQEHKTTLIFTNTRSATERVVHKLKMRYPIDYVGNIEAHHSSLSKDHRLKTEDRLKQGELKVVVSSTSLEMGIDIGSVDLVVLLTSPKSVARALQRVGRSGHKLKDKIKGRFVVLDRDDLIECALILKNAKERKIDKISISKNCLDVLSQQIYGCAIEGRTHIENIYEMVKRSYCYHDIERDDFIEVIKYLAGDYTELEYRYVYAKIWYDLETGEIGKRGKMARVLYATNIGTIPDESYVRVKIGDQVVGVLDEGFLERLKPGDVFVLGGNTYQYRFSRGQTLQVSPVPGKLPTVPSWFSEMLPLSFDLGMEIQKFRKYIESMFRQKKKKHEVLQFIEDYLYVHDNAASSIYEYFREQYLYAKMPHDGKIVIENLHFEDKHYLIFHSCYGRKVNDALSRGFAYVLSKMYQTNVLIGLTDQNFYLQGKKKFNAKELMKQMKKEDLDKILKLAIDKTDVLKRRFRHCAGRALMILRNYKGVRKNVGRQQISSQILINACKRISDNFPILKEARREVLEDLMDVKKATLVLDWVKDRKVKIEYVDTKIPSPFALNLIARGYSDIMKLEDRLEFIKRMHNLVLAKIALGR
jgi:ATP-dependent Lhr-like helicase